MFALVLKRFFWGVIDKQNFGVTQIRANCSPKTLTASVLLSSCLAFISYDFHPFRSGRKREERVNAISQQKSDTHHLWSQPSGYPIIVDVGMMDYESPGRSSRSNVYSSEFCIFWRWWIPGLALNSVLYCSYPKFLFRGKSFGGILVASKYVALQFRVVSSPSDY